MILSVRRTRKKIRVSDGIWTHHLPWSSRMLQPLSYWKLYGEQGPICGSRLEPHHAATQPSKGIRVLSQKNMTGDIVVCKNWQLLGKKQDLGTFYPMGFFTKFPTSTPVLFIWESPRGADILRYQVTDRLISPWVFWLKTNWRLISGRSEPKGYYLFQPVKVCTGQ